jgi:hypothetical protein
VYVSAKTAAPKLICGISSRVVSVILRTWGSGTLTPRPPGTHEQPQQVRHQVCVARLLVSVVSHVRGLQKFKIQSEAENRYYEKTIDTSTYTVLAQPSARGTMGVCEVRHL